MANPETEPIVTSEDLQEKWQEVQVAVREQVEQKVLGLSYLTIGLIAVGAGALGTAYYLGRRGASGGRCEMAVKAAASLPNLPPMPAQSALTPVIDHAVRSVVTAAMDSLKRRSAPQ